MTTIASHAGMTAGMTTMQAAAMYGMEGTYGVEGTYGPGPLYDLGDGRLADEETLRQAGLLSA